MKLRTLAAACAALSTLTFAGAAFAAEPVTAKLQAPVAEKTKFIAGGAMFVCEADACVAQVPTSQTFSTNTCKAVANKVGPVASFEGRKSLEAARLADCNATALAKAASGPQLAKQ
jgi:hypothetical protein